MNNSWFTIEATEQGKTLTHCSEDARGEVVIPDGVTEIGQWAFESSEIESVIIPDSVEVIGDFAFQACINLKHVTIGQGIKHIGVSAFVYCESLESIIIPEGVTQIQDGTFFGCDKLSYAYFPGSVRKIGLNRGERNFFSCFRYCKSLKELHVLNDKALLNLLDKHFPYTFMYAHLYDCTLYTHSFARVEDFPPSRRRFAKRFKAIIKETDIKK